MNTSLPATLHPRIPEELMDEMTHRPPRYTLSHFQDVLQKRAPQRDGIQDAHHA